MSPHPSSSSSSSSCITTTKFSSAHQVSPPPLISPSSSSFIPPPPLPLLLPSSSSSSSPLSASSPSPSSSPSSQLHPSLITTPSPSSFQQASSAHHHPQPWIHPNPSSLHPTRPPRPSPIARSSITTHLSPAAVLGSDPNPSKSPPTPILKLDHPAIDQPPTDDPPTPHHPPKITSSKLVDPAPALDAFLKPPISQLSATRTRGPDHPTNVHYLEPHHSHQSLQFTPASSFQNNPKSLKDVKRRTSKACDNCRKSKCKCTRTPDQNGVIPTTGPCQNCATTGIECTFNGTSRKRGPPKGYIEAIESRLHRMEALLGGLLENDDPRAQALFSELVGDIEVRELLKKDLKIAAQEGTLGKPRKSWKSSHLSSPPISSIRDPRNQLNLTDTQRVLWGVSHLHPSSGSSKNYHSQESIPPNPQSSDPDDDSESEAHLPDRSPTPPPPSKEDHDSYHSHHRHGNRRLSSHPSSVQWPQALRTKAQVPTFNEPTRATTIPHTGTATFTLSKPDSSDPHPARCSDQSIAHDPLQSSSSLFPPTQQHSPATISELADVVGQLSLNENDEVRYHGRSSGLYLISASKRYKDFFWYFPKPGFWPVAPIRRSQTDFEILEQLNPFEAFPTREIMNHLLDIYWAFVHPIMPVLYKPEFMTQFQNLMANLDAVKSARPHWSLNQIWCHAMSKPCCSTENTPSPCSQGLSPSSSPSQPQSSEPTIEGLGPTNRISVLLLLVIFALSSRYSHRSTNSPIDGQYWNAGDNYFSKAQQILNLDYGSSKLTNCQALILMAYREIGSGAMAESWLYTGMAIRMAQDMGLFRDADKWFMPVKKFSYEDKQIRKRVWWACVNMDKYVSTYIGRPMMIFERDYDATFPSTDEPDEHEQWKGWSPDGNPIELSKLADQRYRSNQNDPGTQNQPTSDRQSSESMSTRNWNSTLEQKSHTISCFNRSASLSVLISRIVANIYAIRIRVIGQSSETLLSLLDQNLARWYLDLPEQLHYDAKITSSSATQSDRGGLENLKRAPTPHLLTLHAQFYTALILLHRPFIPASHPKDSTGHRSADAPSPYPSHSICTTAANAITNIAQAYSEAFGLRQAPVFLVYYIFTAAILHVYNASSDPALTLTAKSNLLKCMNSLKEMAPTWTGAVRAWELLTDLVDLRDVDLSDHHDRQESSSPRETISPSDPSELKSYQAEERGLKRSASSCGLEGYASYPDFDRSIPSSSSTQPVRASRKWHGSSPTTSTNHHRSRSTGKTVSRSRPDGSTQAQTFMRSVSSSDRLSMTINNVKEPSGAMPLSSLALDTLATADPLYSGHSSSEARTTEEMQICQKENSSQTGMGFTEFEVNQGQSVVLPSLSSPNETGNSVIANSDKPAGDYGFPKFQMDRPSYLPGNQGLPSTALEEMMGFFDSAGHSFEQQYSPTSHQPSVYPPPQPNVHSQVLSPLLFDFGHFGSSPTGSSSYGPCFNQNVLPTTTIPGIFGLGGPNPKNVHHHPIPGMVPQGQNSQMLYQDNRRTTGSVSGIQATVAAGRGQEGCGGGTLRMGGASCPTMNSGNNDTSIKADDDHRSGAAGMTAEFEMTTATNWFSTPIDSTLGFGFGSLAPPSSSSSVDSCRRSEPTASPW